MVEWLRRLWRFMTTMDARAATSLAVSLVLLAFVLVMFVFGRQWLDLENDGELAQLMSRAAQSPWAVVAVIAIFMVLALTGFPQIWLITAAVLVFGARDGAIYSWIATMASATLTFAIGHYLGGGWLQRYGSGGVRKTIDFISRHGMLASGLVRVVPSAPFIVVNAAAGAAHVPIWKYWLGTGIGIIPKILLISGLSAVFPGAGDFEREINGVLDAVRALDPASIGLVALIVAVWLALALFARRLYSRMTRRDQSE